MENAPVLAAGDHGSPAEAYEFATARPQRYVGYLSFPYGPEREGERVEIRTYAGDVLARGVCTSIRERRRSTMSPTYCYGRATGINGVEYAWQGSGAGIYCRMNALKRQP